MNNHRNLSTKIVDHLKLSRLTPINPLLGVMQATTMGGTKLEKRYSPSFHDETITTPSPPAPTSSTATTTANTINRKPSASKRKRDDVLRLVF